MCISMHISVANSAMSGWCVALRQVTSTNRPFIDDMLNEDADSYSTGFHLYALLMHLFFSSLCNNMKVYVG